MNNQFQGNYKQDKNGGIDYGHYDQICRRTRSLEIRSVFNAASRQLANIPAGLYATVLIVICSDMLLRVLI